MLGGLASGTLTVWVRSAPYERYRIAHDASNPESLQEHDRQRHAFIR